MAPLPETRHLSESIDCDFQSAYAFLSIPENFPKWASGLCGSLRYENGAWLAETPRGPVQLRFSPNNDFGVLDHWVIPSPGVEIYVPMRLLRYGDGCELILTLIRHPGMPEEQFEEDTEWVKRDLAAVKQLLESR